MSSLTLPSELTIYSLCALKERCLDALPKPSKSKKGSSKEASALAVDSSGVSEVDAAGIQLLQALAKSLAARRKTLHLVNPSLPLINACTSLGMGSLLASPEPIA